MNALAAMPPLQTVCTAQGCQRRQKVPMTEVYHKNSPGKAGGTQRTAGCLCRFCGQEIDIAPSFLRKGVLQNLPSRAQMLSSRAPIEQIGKTAARSWTLGAEALDLLDEAIRRIETGGGDLVGLALEDGMQIIVEVPRTRRDLLESLDEGSCHLMVACGPNGDGSKWQLVFHPAAGAATLESTE